MTKRSPQQVTKLQLLLTAEGLRFSLLSSKGKNKKLTEIWKRIKYFDSIQIRQEYQQGTC